MTRIILPLVLFFFLFQIVHSPILTTDPRQASTRNPAGESYPAGDERVSPRAASHRQARPLPNSTPFTPRSPGFRCRAGVRADQMGNEQQHMRYGKCYTGRIYGTFQRAGVIEVELNISSNHNGFLETCLCDVEKCGGDISEQFL